MKIMNQMKMKLCRPLFLLILLGLLAGAGTAHAVIPFPGGTNNAVSYNPLDYWWFDDTNTWTSERGHSPVSFTNLTFSYLGNGPALVVDSTNAAWLQYNAVETNGATNITVGVGSVTFWYAPHWASTNQGGSGAGEYGRLLEIGGYTPNSSFGLWSLYFDDVGQNLYFSAQTNDLSSNFCTYVTAPISFTTNYWHFIAFTYSATNTALYIDGELATNGPAITNYPGPNALANGFFVGSDSNGIYQAHGMIDDLNTYNVPVDADTIYSTYFESSAAYYLNPLNQANFRSAGSNPSTNSGTPDVITGSGDLQWTASASTCYSSTNPYIVWLTNITAVAVGGGTMNVTFTIEGGQDGYAYDVFAIGALPSPISNGQWYWMGQGYHCNTYTLPITGSGTAFIILGTPQDTDNDGLTDAYEKLVSKTDPNNAYSNIDGITDGWDVLLGLDPHNSNLTDPSKRAGYGYTAADWLNAVSGAKSGTVNADAEGNVLSVSQ